MSETKNDGQIELKLFIQETLVQIIRDVKSAQDDIKTDGGEICPTGLYFTTGQEKPIIYKPGRGIVQTVEFDIAVSTIKTTEGGGKAGVGISVINLGARGSHKRESAAVNRVKFTVPILFPSEFYDWAEKTKLDLEGKI